MLWALACNFDLKKASGILVISILEQTAIVQK